MFESCGNENDATFSSMEKLRYPSSCFELSRKRTISAFDVHRIKLLGDPKTIIDVGVGQGTLPLYSAFPDSKIVLVEPLNQEHDQALRDIQRMYKNTVLLPIAVGASNYTADINVEKESPDRSSLLERTILTKTDGRIEKMQVQVRRLDDALSGYDLCSPFGVKIDTEGFELDVLKGCTRILSKVEFFIIETSVSKRFENSYLFEELIVYMSNIGFTVADMLDFSQCDKVGMLYMDLVFKPK